MSVLIFISYNLSLTISFFVIEPGKCGWQGKGEKLIKFRTVDSSKADFPIPGVGKGTYQVLNLKLLKRASR